MVDGEIERSDLECSVKCMPNPLSKWMYQIGRCINEPGILGLKHKQVIGKSEIHEWY